MFWFGKGHLTPSCCGQGHLPLEQAAPNLKDSVILRKKHSWEVAEPACKWQVAAYFQIPALGKGLAISIPALLFSPDSCSARHLWQPKQGSFPEVCNHLLESSIASSAVSQAPAHSQVIIGREKKKLHQKTGVNSALQIRARHKWPSKSPPGKMGRFPTKRLSQSNGCIWNESPW